MKNIRFLLFIFVLFFNLNMGLNNLVLADESQNSETKIPDYTYEFIGNDKFENFNRKIFTFNLKFNKYVVRPVNILWASVMPQAGMDKIKNFYNNTSYPVRLASCLFQKDFDASKVETKRFFTNLTVGILGFNDAALTKYKLEPRDEDMGQVLAYHNVKRGPYLVLPIIAQGNIRDLAGEALDLPFNPTTYIVGPISLASTSLSLMNETTAWQGVFKMADNYADPYDVSKKSYGIDRYIKNENLDRKEVLAEKSAEQNLIDVKYISKDDSDMTQKYDLQADIKLANFHPQGSTVGALRTIYFDNKSLDSSKWAELSVWNKTFAKQIKTAAIKINPDRAKYKFRYIMQPDKNSPIAIIYPSIGEGIMSQESIIEAKLLYDEGYSVMIMGSSFQWEFVKSMPANYRPGLPYQDAKYLRTVTGIALDQLQGKYSCVFSKRILVGTSFGALTGLFVANEEENERNTLGISHYIFICPPIQTFYAMQQIDKFSQDWKNNPSDIKMRAAILTRKIIKTSTEAASGNLQAKSVPLPFNDEESKLAIGFAMGQKLSDVIYTIENYDVASKSSDVDKDALYKTINNTSFYDYAKKYIVAGQNKTMDELDYEASLYSMADFLRTNKKYKIYHSVNDCFVNPEQLSWLKRQTGNKTILFSDGSHLGFLYRSEFLNEFRKSTAYKNSGI